MIDYGDLRDAMASHERTTWALAAFRRDPNSPRAGEELERLRDEWRESGVRMRRLLRRVTTDHEENMP